MIRASILTGILAALLFTAAPPVAQACRVAIASISFAPGSTDISRTEEAELIRWVGDSAKRRGARVNVLVNPKAPDAVLQRARGVAVANRLRELGLRRDAVVVSVRTSPSSSSTISVSPDPDPCRDF